MESRFPLESLLFDPDKEADWSQTLLTVPNERGETVAFNFTLQQRMMSTDRTGRDIRVKGRQTRSSSEILANNTREASTRYGINIVTVAQTNDITQLFRERVKHHFEDLANNNLPYDILQDNEDRLVISRGAGVQNVFVWGSAEQKTGPRGVQTAHRVHFSEYAHWPMDKQTLFIGAVQPACPPPPWGCFEIESTPNGAQGLFYKLAVEGRPYDPNSMWTTHFYPWWLEATYTIESYASLFDVDQLRAEFKPTEEETNLMAKNELGIDRILWRRVMSSALRKAGKFFAQEYPEDITSCFLSTGENFFFDPDYDHLDYFRQLVRPPRLTLAELPYGDSVVSLRGHTLRVWELPAPGGSYVAFLDAAEGVMGGDDSDPDFAALVIIDRTTKHHVATLRLRAPPEQVGAMACAVCKMYNMAYLGIERNSYGAAALRAAQSLNYPRLYRDTINEKKNPKFGWYTSEQSRERMLTELKSHVFSHTLLTFDEVLVMEMSTFDWEQQKTGKGHWRPESRGGAHDDLVMAMAGALTIAPRAPVSRSEATGGDGLGYTIGEGHQPFMR